MASVPAIIAVTESQTWLGNPPIDDATTFSNMVNATNQSVAAFLGRDPTSQMFTELYSGNGGQTIIPRHFPVTALTSITVVTPGWSAYTQTAIDVTQVVIDRDELVWPFGCFPRGVKNVQVVYTAGYLSTDAEMQQIRSAAFITLKAMWTGRGADQNSSSQSFSGVMSQSFWSNGPGSMPPQAQAILLPYKSFINQS